MTPRQEMALKILQNNMDADHSCSISIHALGYPVTPDSINPALADLQTLKELSQISSYERTSSRGVKVDGIMV